jgi:hypothetical protein
LPSGCVAIEEEEGYATFYPDHILKEMEISLAFHKFSFSHNSRNCNKVAHYLARQISSLHRSEVWLDALTCVYDSIDFLDQFIIKGKK